jgi:hypothetical protein
MTPVAASRAGDAGFVGVALRLAVPGLLVGVVQRDGAGEDVRYEVRGVLTDRPRHDIRALPDLW